MLITDFTVKKVSDAYVLLEWTATDTDKQCWVYKNGVLIDKIYDTSTDEREAYISIEPDETFLIEIHECTKDDFDTLANEEEPVSTFVESEKTYNLHWDSVDDAICYNIYHTSGSGSEKLVYKYYADSELDEYEWTTPELESEGGVWHGFRVESVDEWGNVSERDKWYYFVYGMPEIVSDVTLVETGTPNLFNLNVEI